jgi:anaerobic carbon-monoxide dehydrogenase iron sulfur subunit
MKRIKICRSKCIGCLTCTAACMIAHEDNESRSRIVLDKNGKYNPIFCKECKSPECSFVCPTGAMHKEKDSELIYYDKEKCISCYMCIMACPYGVLKAGETHHKQIMKCDMCKDTPEHSPRCVAKCPMGAITLEDEI